MYVEKRRQKLKTNQKKGERGLGNGDKNRKIDLGRAEPARNARRWHPFSPQEKECCVRRKGTEEEERNRRET